MQNIAQYLADLSAELTSNTDSSDHPSFSDATNHFVEESSAFSPPCEETKSDSVYFVPAQL